MAASTLNIDRGDYRIDGRLFGRMWRLIRPFWTRRESWPAWLAAGAAFLFLPLSTYLSIELSFLTRTTTNALIAKHAAAYWVALWALLLVHAGQAVSIMSLQLLDGWLGQYWRRWLTMHLVDQYLSRRTYYDIALAEDLDNPDQRIQENVTPFVTAMVSFPRTVLLQLLLIASNGAVLATINQRMVPVVLIYAVIQAIGIYLAYAPTIRQNFEIQVAEADLRYGILHVRDNAEAIAFYSGEAAERMQIWHRLKLAVQKNLNFAYYSALGVQGVASIFAVMWVVLPYLVLSPLYLTGQLSFGAITQGVAAAAQILVSFRLLTTIVPEIAKAAPQAIRLAQIQERFDDLDRGRRDAQQRRLHISHTTDHVVLRHVNLETPGGEQYLVRDLSLSISAADNLVIVGQTGVGKSSLLRAMSGLWTRGEGLIEMPEPRSCLFLPQRPYMILSNLRSQLLYPHHPQDISDERLEAILAAVSLPDLLEKHGGFAAVRDWGKVLSLGEQQRIGFARVLVSSPKFVFLDEATSAVDMQTERRLYDLLQGTSASYISVGHRLSILDYHARMLTLMPGGGWSLEPVRRTSVIGAENL